MKRYEWGLTNLIYDMNLLHKLGGKACIIHAGRYITKRYEISKEECYKNYINSLKYVIDNTKVTKIYIETPATKKNTIINSLEEFAKLYNKIPINYKKRVKICIDTCHIFVSGYNISSKEGVDEYFNKFNKLIGIKNLKFIHLNDSFGELNSHLNRHAPIGKGCIFKKSKEGLKEIIKICKKNKIPFVLETNSKTFSKNLKIIKNINQKGGVNPYPLFTEFCVLPKNNSNQSPCNKYADRAYCNVRNDNDWNTKFHDTRRVCINLNPQEVQSFITNLKYIINYEGFLKEPYMYVIIKNGYDYKFCFCDQHDFSVSHACLAYDNNVIAAGIFDVQFCRNITRVYFNNESGHYKPDSLSCENVINYFFNNNFFIDDMGKQVEVIYRPVRFDQFNGIQQFNYNNWDGGFISCNKQQYSNQNFIKNFADDFGNNMEMGGGKKNKKDLIIKIFEDILDYYKTLNNNKNKQFKIDSTEKMIKELKKLKKIETINDIKNINSIGKKSLDKINTILKTNKLKQHNNIKKDLKKIKTLKSFQRIYGVGPKFSKKLLNNGVKNINNLKSKVKSKKIVLTNAQKKSLNHYKNLKERIPYNKITKITNILKEHIKKEKIKCRLLNAGSYAMKKNTSGDIDLMMVFDGKNYNYSEIKQKFRDLLIKNKYMIYNLLDGSEKDIYLIKILDKVNQLDIAFVENEHKYFYMLYFSSSKDFSKKIRKIASDKGYKLNEKGLFNKNTNKKVNFIPKNEKDIFNFLNIKYIKKENR